MAGTLVKLKNDTLTRERQPKCLKKQKFIYIKIFDIAIMLKVSG